MVRGRFRVFWGRWLRGLGSVKVRFGYSLGWGFVRFVFFLFFSLFREGDGCRSFRDRFVLEVWTFSGRVR